MKFWERSLTQAMGQTEAARSAMLNVRGHIMPDAARESLRVAQAELDNAIALMRRYIDDEPFDVSVPWERAS